MVPSGSDPPSGGGSRDAAQDLLAALHETTNALTVVLGWLERARQPGAPDSEVTAAIERASRNALATRTALRRAIGASVEPEPPEPVAELGRRVLDDLTVEANARGVELELDLAHEIATRLVEPPSAVWQILVNLLLNAIAATPKGGRVALATESADAQHESVRWSVRDEGPGIAPEQQERIFEPRVTGRPGGAGIGLGHARSLAQAHGGQLMLAKSQVGARFELTWPCRPAAAGATTAAASSPAIGKVAAKPARLDGRKVLLLEDDPAVVELLELSLTARGATLQAARSEDELLAKLEREPVDTLLIDLSPLEGSLEAFTARARSRRPDLAIVVVSGSPDPPEGADHWVRKPFEPAELARVIAEAGGRSDR